MPKTVRPIVEQQIDMLGVNVQQHGTHSLSETAEPEPADVLVVSSANGSSGSRIATAVGALLDVPVYGHAIVAHIVKSADVRIATVETLEETARRAIYDDLGALFRERSFNQGDDLHALAQTIAALGRLGPCLFVGHGFSVCFHGNSVLRYEQWLPSEHDARGSSSRRDLTSTWRAARWNARMLYPNFFLFSRD